MISPAYRITTTDGQRWLSQRAHAAGAAWIAEYRKTPLSDRNRRLNLARLIEAAAGEAYERLATTDEYKQRMAGEIIFLWPMYLLSFKDGAA